MRLKEKVHAACLQLLTDKIKVIQDNLQGLTQGAENDNKSSAGDKHETARAMMQLEQEGTICKHVSPESGADFWFSPKSETFCATCGQLALPGVHTQPECPRRKQ